MYVCTYLSNLRIYIYVYTYIIWYRSTCFQYIYVYTCVRIQGFTRLYTENDALQARDYALSQTVYDQLYRTVPITATVSRHRCALCCYIFRSKVMRLQCARRGSGPRGPGGGRGDCAEGYVCVYSYVFTPSGLHDRPALQATAHTDDSVVLRGFGFKPRFRLASSLQPKTKPTTPAKICRDCRKCLFLIISWSAFLWLPSTPQPQNHSKQSKDPERMPDCFRFWRSKVYGDLAL